MKLAILGLGKMGKGISEKLLLDGHEIVIWNRSRESIEAFLSEEKKVEAAFALSELETLLSTPRIIWSMLPSGDPTEIIMEQILTIAKQGDIVIDGGNAHFRDTERRSALFSQKGISFFGIGVSGGVRGLHNGFSLMVGGEKEVYNTLVPLFKSLSKPHGAYAYFGKGGAGHFVKMVHNGIEYGMMQALGEGFGVLQSSDYNLDLPIVAKTWQKGTIISSFLVDRVVDVLEDDAKLAHIIGNINATGEAAWTVEEAEKKHLPISIIKESLEFRLASQKDSDIQKTTAARLISALRNAFGGHEVKKR